MWATDRERAKRFCRECERNVLAERDHDHGRIAVIVLLTIVTFGLALIPGCLWLMIFKKPFRCMTCGSRV